MITVENHILCMMMMVDDVLRQQSRCVTWVKFVPVARCLTKLPPLPNPPLPTMPIVHFLGTWYYNNCQTEATYCQWKTSARNVYLLFVEVLAFSVQSFAAHIYICGWITSVSIKPLQQRSKFITLGVQWFTDRFLSIPEIKHCFYIPNHLFFLRAICK